MSKKALSKMQAFWGRFSRQTQGWHQPEPRAGTLTFHALTKSLFKYLNLRRKIDETGQKIWVFKAGTGLGVR